jgi:hypothetical protein
MDRWKGWYLMTAIHAPHLFINNYLATKISELFKSETMPFFPSMPTSINEFTEQFPEGAFAVYDRMFKMRRKAFPHIKCEQLLYYFYRTSGGIEKLYETQQLLQDVLDRGDESAQELNSWIYNLWISQDEKTETGIDIISGQEETKNIITFANKSFLLPYFHEIKIFQLEETRDIIDFGTARTWAGNKVIIDYDWHSS